MSLCCMTERLLSRGRKRSGPFARTDVEVNTRELPQSQLVKHNYIDFGALRFPNMFETILDI